MAEDLLGRPVPSSDAILNEPPGIEEISHPLLRAAAWRAHRKTVLAETGVSHGYPNQDIENLVADAYKISNMLCQGYWGTTPTPELLHLASELVNDEMLFVAFLPCIRQSCREWFRRGDPAWLKNPRGRLGEAYRALPTRSAGNLRGTKFLRMCGYKPEEVQPAPHVVLKEEANDWIREQARAGKMKLAEPAAEHAQCKGGRA